VFAHLPMDYAFISWLTLGISSAAIGLFCLLRLRPFSIYFCLSVELAIASSYPVVLGVAMGQFCFVLLALVCTFTYAFLKNQDILAGLALAGLSIKPHYALFLIVPPLAQKRWKILGVAASSFLILTLWSACVLGANNVLSYPAIVLSADSNPDYIGVRPEKMVSVRNVTLHLLPRSLQLPVSLLAMVAALIYCYSIWHRAKSVDDDKHRMFFWLMAATCLLTLTFSPHSHVYDLLLLAPLALTLERTSLTDALTQGSTAQRIWSALVMLYPLIIWSIMCVGLLTHGQPFLMIFALNLLLLLLVALKLQLPNQKTAFVRGTN